MRIMIKGGVWKNTEDEILKAAVMKYGKNQWARISSLLVRKSAKQCKARWYEWLDPSIKKTDWTREEDEKLLHLAKLIPTQWRTIAPIVGRTPAQCLERYEKLLDAVGKDENYEPADDPRKLRPGEIDPNPESKPARPDPVDMDEDEKEMLSEARARLANTRGKKAKRKAREKQLEEARRLAALQKRRELKAAGIGSRLRKRKLKGIDYNEEIPFQKRPPPGFYDVSGEEGSSEQPRFPTTIEELEGKRRVDVEAALRKQDIARNKIAQRKDAPSAILQASKLNDPGAVRKRSKLMLPAPQISDRELEEIAKMGSMSEALAAEEGGGQEATRALVANYGGATPARSVGATPGRTPQRTPGGKGDAIMMEAENLLRLRETQTPLFGGANPELHPSDFSGVTPKKREVATPNVMATPGGGAASVLGTPMSSVGGTPRSDAKEERRRVEEARRSVQASLKALPTAQNQYDTWIPELPAEEEDGGDDADEDMSDVAARARAQLAARQAELLRKRSQVIQRGLPRPPVEAAAAAGGGGESAGVEPEMEAARALVRAELARILEHDNAKYPLTDSKKKANGVAREAPELEELEESALKEAAKLIKEEAEVVRSLLGHDGSTLAEFTAIHEELVKDEVYFPQKGYGPLSTANTAERLGALQYEFENLKKVADAEIKKAAKLEQKVSKYTAGYKARADSLAQDVESTFKEAQTLDMELACYRSLHQQEQLAAPRRIEELQDALQQQVERERLLQSRYQSLLDEQDSLKLAAAAVMQA